jgi:hypothetical protein
VFWLQGIVYHGHFLCASKLNPPNPDIKTLEKKCLITLDKLRYIVIISDISCYILTTQKGEHLLCLVTNLPTSIQDTEKSQECHPGYAIEEDTLITMAGNTVMDRLVKINGEGAGRLHGYRKNGRDLNSLQCEEVADPLALVDRLGLEVKEAGSLAVAI